MKNRVAAIIPNYNMPERTNALRRHIEQYCSDVEVIVVNNGSDFNGVDPCEVTLSENVQTTNAWLMGLQYADALEQKYHESFFAYWFIITSAEFVLGWDPLGPMVEKMQETPSVVGMHPALTKDSTTSWKHMITDDSRGFREVGMLDNICALWRADWFNSIGRFDPRLYYAWGIDLETSMKARQAGKKMLICEEMKVKKITDIGYTMRRMNMTAEERRQLARSNMDLVFTEKYGPRWRKLMYGEWSRE